MEQISPTILSRDMESCGGNFFSPEFAIVMDSKDLLSSNYFRLKEPYRSQEGRILRILSGKAAYNINMADYAPQAGDVCFVPDGCVVEMLSYSDDFSAQVMSVSGLPLDKIPSEVICAHLSDADNERVGRYFSLVREVVSRQGFSFTTVLYLLLALLDDLHNIDAKRQPDESHAPSRDEVVTGGFMKLVKEHAAQEHRIRFYADRLFITPNRLSTVIKKHSGETPMYWINRAIILEAKVLLKHSDLRIFEIADRLNFANPSFFNKFFKAQTGLTPREYQRP